MVFYFILYSIICLSVRDYLQNSIDSEGLDFILQTVKLSVWNTIYVEMYFDLLGFKEKLFLKDIAAVCF
jgi:hypothetical protein